MKRMSEVFDLPLPISKINSINTVYIYAYDLVPEKDIAITAAHAINHVDALADALAEIISQDKINGFVSDSAIVSAEITLKAYRGDK